MELVSSQESQGKSLQKARSELLERPEGKVNNSGDFSTAPE